MPTHEQLYRTHAHPNPMGMGMGTQCRALLFTPHTSRDHEIVRAHKKVSNARHPNTLSKSCSVLKDPQV